jgi:hypothetical protein
MTWFISNMIWSNGVAFLSALIWLAAAAVRIPKTAWLVMSVGGGSSSPELEPLFTDYDCNRFCTLLQPSLWLFPLFLNWPISRRR